MEGQIARFSGLDNWHACSTQTNLYLLHISTLPDLQILKINRHANKFHKAKYQRQDIKQIGITVQWKPQ